MRRVFFSVNAGGLRCLSPDGLLFSPPGPASVPGGGAAEAGVGLGLVIALNRNRAGLDVEDLTELKW